MSDHDNPISNKKICNSGGKKTSYKFHASEASTIFDLSSSFTPSDKYLKSKDMKEQKELMSYMTKMTHKKYSNQSNVTLIDRV